MRRRSIDTIMLAVFFAAGALICLLVVLALAFPESFLESIWRLKPEARLQFQQIGGASIALIAVVELVCGLAAIGLARKAIGGLMIWYLLAKK